MESHHQCNSIKLTVFYYQYSINGVALCQWNYVTVLECNYITGFHVSRIPFWDSILPCYWNFVTALEFCFWIVTLPDFHYITGTPLH